MNEPFVPLIPAGDAGQNRAEFRVAIVSQIDTLRPFQALGHAGNQADAGSQCEPRVTLKREGERVSAIHIRCRCGQTIELACVYEKAKG